MAIAGILFWVLLMPTYDGIQLKREAIAERDVLIKDRNDVIANISSLSEEYAKRSTDIARFKSIVPDVKSVPELVSSIQDLATKNGLQLTTLTISGNAKNQTENPYQDQYVEINLSGNYPAFKSFLISLERNIRLIDITSIGASPISENTSLINFNIKGNAYYVKK